MTKVCENENCGRTYPTRKRNQKYCRPSCIPRSVYQMAGKKAQRPERIFKQRAIKFHEDVERLCACQPITREDIVASFQVIYERGLHARRSLKFKQLRRLEHQKVLKIVKAS